MSQTSIPVNERDCQAHCSPQCRGKAAHEHHRKRRSQNGDESPANKLDVCVPCHQWIHDNPERAYEHGLLVKSFDDPAQVPVADIPHAHAKQQCPKCKGTGTVTEEVKQPKTDTTPRQRRVWSIRVPADQRENGAELLDDLIDTLREMMKDDFGWSDTVPPYTVVFTAGGLVALHYDELRSDGNQPEEEK